MLIILFYSSKTKTSPIPCPISCFPHTPTSSTRSNLISANHPIHCHTHSLQPSSSHQLTPLWPLWLYDPARHLYCSDLVSPRHSQLCSILPHNLTLWRESGYVPFATSETTSLLTTMGSPRPIFPGSSANNTQRYSSLFPNRSYEYILQWFI